MRKKKGFYSISVVAKMFSVHQQTIRMYEKQGLISPKRSEGNTRLFSEDDVERLEEVIYLTHKLGVNLVGVEMILKLQKKVKRMQDEMNKIFKDTEGEFEREKLNIREDMKKQAERLATLRKDNLGHTVQPEAPVIMTLPGSTSTQKKLTGKRKEKPVGNVEEAGQVSIYDDFEIDYDDDK